MAFCYTGKPILMRTLICAALLLLFTLPVPADQDLNIRVKVGDYTYAVVHGGLQRRAEQDAIAAPGSEAGKQHPLARPASRRVVRPSQT